MNENHNCKTKHRESNEVKLLNNRINRIEGQLSGIKNMIATDAYCDDILTQISAVANALKSLGRFVLNNHLKYCVKNELLAGNNDIIDDIIKSFGKLM